MNWEVVGVTIAFMVIGYLIGSISVSVLVTRFLKIEDVRKKGSKNAGATNANRVHGPFIGISVLLLDMCKPMISGAIPLMFFDTKDVWIQPVIFASVIGHVFPLFFDFKGGKGAANFAGTLIFLNWSIFMIAVIIFFGLIFLTKKVSIGSIATPWVVTLIYILFNISGDYHSSVVEPITHEYSLWLNILFLTMLSILILYTHRENIIRLINNEENKIIVKKH